MLFYLLQSFLSEVRLEMDFKHKHSFEHHFKVMRVQHQSVTLKAEPGNWGKLLHSRESRSFRTTQLAEI